MTTFVVGSGVGDNYATLLLELPDVDWMKAAIMGALYQLTVTGNWREEGDVATSFAVEEASQMVAGYRFMNFNPFPVGMIIPYPSDVTPDGYLPCDGVEQNVSDYPELFNIIGYTFGGSDDVFNTPALQEATLVDKGDVYSVGEYFGNTTIALALGQLPPHHHTIPLTEITLAVEPGEVPVLSPIPVLTDVTGDTGSNAEVDIRPYSMAVHYVIYAGRV